MVLEIDSQGFVKASGNLDIFKQKAKEVAEQSSKTEKSVVSLDDAFRAISPSTLAAVAGVTALIGAVKGLIGVGSNMMAITSHFEQTQKSLETVLQSAEKGQKLFEDLRKFSFDTTFGVDELASASSQLLNVGVQVKDLQGQLKMLGDLAQGDKNKFAELTSIFAKVQSTGKVSSMQLQQFALRGVPIIQTLKDMGIQGSTTAENLTKAFQKLTEEGGQFHNAMNNIIDTIEGKKGFISDTLKEIAVNFGDLAGITDAYKKSLDGLYNILDWVNNKLIEWKDNPFMSALISGLVTTAISALVAIIGVALVNAIIKLNTQLAITATLKAALSGPAGWITLAVVGVAGITAGLIGAAKAADNQLQAQEKITKELREQKELAERYKNGDPELNSRNSRLEQYQEDLESYRKLLETVTKKRDEAKQKLGWFDTLTSPAYTSGTKTADWIPEEFRNDVWVASIQGNLDELKDSLTETFEKSEKGIKSANGLIEGTEKSIARVKKEIEAFGDPNAYTQAFQEAYDEMTKLEDKANGGLSSLENQLQNIQLYKALDNTFDNDGKFIYFNAEQKKQIDDTINYLQKKIDDVKFKLKIENADEWMKLMQKAYGFDDKTLAKLMDGTANGGINGGQATRDYVQKLVEQSRTEQKVNELMGWNQGKTTKDYTAEVVQEAMKTYQTLLSSGQFGTDKNGKLDKTSQEFMMQIKSLEQVFKASGGTVEEWNIIVGNTTDDIEKLGEDSEKAAYSLSETLVDYAKSSIKNTDVGTFLESYAKTGSVLLSILEVLIKDIIDVVGGNERVKYMLDIIKHHLEALSPLLEAILNILTIVEVIIRPLLNLINKGLKAIFGNFNKWFDDFYKSWEIEDEKKKKKDNALTNQYEALLKAIKEQEEYYIRKKAELNMLGLEDKVTRVNDMILTPHGTFSTNPQDTIIATKNPQRLGGVVNNIKIINNAGVGVNVTENKGSNMNEILVTISKKIANDVANGFNGWDGAFAMQKQRVDGRRI